MGLSIRESGPGFVGEVSGVDITRDLDAATFAAIQEGIDHHGVLVFHDQPLDHARQIAFSRRLGELERTISKSRSAKHPPEIADISNVDHNGRHLPPTSRKVIFNRGNGEWHSDSSFKPVPAKYSLLSAREIPPVGGETEFADMRAAYDAWPGMEGVGKADLEGLICEHSLVYSRLRNTGEVFTETQKAELPTVRQALIRTHPATGRKNFFVGAHVVTIVGWPEEPARALIDSLIDWCVQPRFVHQHRWQQHDLVMWDNRRVMHRGLPFDEAAHRRVMARTTVAGDGPTAPPA